MHREHEVRKRQRKRAIQSTDKEDKLLTFMLTRIFTAQLQNLAFSLNFGGLNHAWQFFHGSCVICVTYGFYF